MSKHTSEPWPHFIEWCEPATPHPDSDGFVGLGFEDYQRARACVNACRGLDTEDLESNGLVSAVGNQLLLADDRAEGQEREIGRLAHVAANAENELAGALNQLDELRAAMANIAHLKWRDHLKGLDRPTDFAEREAALRALGDAQSIAREAIAKSKP